MNVTGLHFWEDRFASDEYAYGKEPNAFFASVIASLMPGKALFPAEGEGRNAVHAASLGWRVQAFDTSSTGMLKAQRLAEERDCKIEYTLTAYTDFVGNGEFDLLVAIFNHMPRVVRQKVHRQYMAALKPGGLLVLEAFNPMQITRHSGGPKQEDMLYSSTDLRADFSELNILHLEETQRILDEGKFHRGPAELIQFIGKKK